MSKKNDTIVLPAKYWNLLVVELTSTLLNKRLLLNGDMFRNVYLKGCLTNDMKPFLSMESSIRPRLPKVANMLFSDFGSSTTIETIDSVIVDQIAPIVAHEWFQADFNKAFVKEQSDWLIARGQWMRDMFNFCGSRLLHLLADGMLPHEDPLFPDSTKNVV